mmetsp:Transcript_99255/g.319916  ORF Transcript_99255/g.319916 Transcript_99255/m.319916 type:complete len:206 (-) Transcript_99255:598-1215(-)
MRGGLVVEHYGLGHDDRPRLRQVARSVPAWLRAVVAHTFSEACGGDTGLDESAGRERSCAERGPCCASADFWLVGPDGRRAHDGGGGGRRGLARGVARGAGAGGVGRQRGRAADRQRTAGKRRRAGNYIDLLGSEPRAGKRGWRRRHFASERLRRQVRRKDPRDEGRFRARVSVHVHCLEEVCRHYAIWPELFRGTSPDDGEWKI